MDKRLRWNRMVVIFMLSYAVNLRDLCLEGKLAPELRQLTHLKSIILRNNLFWGTIPEEIGELRELEVLDLGNNNFSGSLPSNFDKKLSLSILLLDNNKYLSSIPPEIYDVKIVSKSQVIDNPPTTDDLRATRYRQSSVRNTMQSGFIGQRKLLQVMTSPNPMKSEKDMFNKAGSKSSSPSSSPMSPSPSPSPSPSVFFPTTPSSFISVPPSTYISPSTVSVSPSPSVFLIPSASTELPPRASSPPPVNPLVTVRPRRVSSAPLSSPASAPLSSPASVPRQTVKNTTEPKHHLIIILTGIIGCSLFIFVLAVGLFYFRRSKVVTVKPWATGLSGQLQKAFVAGVPKLQRSELETACEDFSNIIGSLSNGTVYKGTLSSGCEIAVTSTEVMSAKDWTKNLEAQFRNKIDTLSKLNHRNFVNLIGYCEEAEPFTRMMVFEYAPNGTLFEHLHIKESEHLDWVTRLRIAMGIAYCLEYMHHLTPPMAHGNLQSSSVYLTEDYAAKISDFSFWNEATAAKMGPSTMELLETPLVDPESNVELLETPLVDPESNVYSFGVIMLEIITGRLLYSVGNGSVVDWTLDCLRQERPLRDVVDPTLKYFEEQQLEKLLKVAKECVLPDPTQRPTMRDVTSKLKEITGLGQDGVTPKLSPLWWAELEILSTEST
ncbi:Leucine-rich repeat protein kinase family protein [Forsythia ovata]|uniref:Leucine-rich repeat protein kinase family protein n=1 Tax=Forsythia ovata TaxID=205694 RepID=A0ABD1RKF3_9LAMI